MLTFVAFDLPRPAGPAPATVSFYGMSNIDIVDAVPCKRHGLLLCLAKTLGLSFGSFYGAIHGLVDIGQVLNVGNDSVP